MQCFTPSEFAKLFERMGNTAWPLPNSTSSVDQACGISRPVSLRSVFERLRHARWGAA